MMMRKSVILVAIASLAGSATATPATAHGPLGKKYLRLYERVKDRHGDRAPGRNIVRRGVNSGRAAHRSEVRRSIGVLDRMLAPVSVARPAAFTPTAHWTAPAASSASSTSSSSSGLPTCTWKPESGGSYTASNPSGAYGKYQIMPVHYTSNGVCAGMGKSPGEQETCARRVFDSQGAGAWVNC